MKCFSNFNQLIDSIISKIRILLIQELKRKILNEGFKYRYIDQKPYFIKKMILASKFPTQISQRFLNQLANFCTTGFLLILIFDKYSIVIIEHLLLRIQKILRLVHNNRINRSESSFSFQKQIYINCVIITIYKLNSNFIQVDNCLFNLK
ncbi:unnamed protein product [Paramecium pentaurelia]|uniref:Uncharacterized protein n=1 Tax=Paramecium pentaurelia TaxID=43138 RepID=A0A8S1YMB1_9CILI|nr:unnamed protein product [Paramecium pentaurelia]